MEDFSPFSFASEHMRSALQRCSARACDAKGAHGYIIFLAECVSHRDSNTVS